MIKKCDFQVCLSFFANCILSLMVTDVSIVSVILLIPPNPIRLTS